MFPSSNVAKMLVVVKSVEIDTSRKAVLQKYEVLKGLFLLFPFVTISGTVVTIKHLLFDLILLLLFCAIYQF